MTEDLAPGLTELIAYQVAERFQRPPKVQVMARAADPQEHGLPPVAHWIEVLVMVETHFQSHVAARTLHGWQQSLDPDALMYSVHTALSMALGQQKPKNWQYLTDPSSWFVAPDLEGEFPYEPPSDWPDIESPDFETPEEEVWECNACEFSGKPHVFGFDPNEPFHPFHNRARCPNCKSDDIILKEDH